MRSGHGAATNDPPQMVLPRPSISNDWRASDLLVLRPRDEAAKRYLGGPASGGVALYLAAKRPLDRIRKRSRPIRVTSHLYGDHARPRIPGFVDSLVVFGFSTVVGCRRQADVTCDLPSVMERPIEDFPREHCRKLGTDAAQQEPRRLGLKPVSADIRTGLCSWGRILPGKSFARSETRGGFFGNAS
jgi:hypothetical protein